jgi:hypothetical protein
MVIYVSAFILWRHCMGKTKLQRLLKNAALSEEEEVFFNKNGLYLHELPLLHDLE